jgi:murein L,D-transpeptidase YafK
VNYRSAATCLLAFALCAVGYSHAASTQWLGSEPAEQQLIEVIDAVESGADDKAFELAAALTESYPTFQLAQLIYGDLLSAQGMSAVVINDQRKHELDKLRGEARARLSHQQPHNRDGMIAHNLLMLSNDYHNVLVFELDKSRVYLFENQLGTPQLIDSYYMSIGKGGIDKQIEGDNKTPLGVYRITSYLSDESLPELYGAGAYPINYPNSWDLLQGKTGHGIWLHGVPRATYSRPPLDSEGCMVVSNVNLEKIGPNIDLSKTPVVLTRNVRWVKSSENELLRTTILAHFEQWRKDWTSLDVDAYLRHYSKDFSTRKHNYDSWQSHKRRVALGKSFIEVNTTGTDFFVYPDENVAGTLVVVNFRQSYNSNNFNSVSRKQQFWRQEQNGEWRIVYEGV